MRFRIMFLSIVETLWCIQTATAFGLVRELRVKERGEGQIRPLLLVREAGAWSASARDHETSVRRS